MEKSNEILFGEFIGKYVEVKGKKIKGKVIDETKNSFLVKTEENMKKRILKENNIFEFKMQNGNAVVDGASILVKPEDRIKIKNGR